MLNRIRVRASRDNRKHAGICQSDGKIRRPGWRQVSGNIERMSELLELREPLEVDTCVGRGLAIIYERGNDESFWVVVLHKNGAIVTLRQRFVKCVRNYTAGRNFSDKEMRQVLDKSNGQSSAT
jgi:hypothetical protein